MVAGNVWLAVAEGTAEGVGVRVDVGAGVSEAAAWPIVTSGSICDLSPFPHCVAKGIARKAETRRKNL